MGVKAQVNSQGNIWIQIDGDGSSGFFACSGRSMSKGEIDIGFDQQADQSIELFDLSRLQLAILRSNLLTGYGKLLQTIPGVLFLLFAH